jgi:hypothetical protein
LTHFWFFSENSIPAVSVGGGGDLGGSGAVEGGDSESVAFDSLEADNLTVQDGFAVFDGAHDTKADLMVFGMPDANTGAVRGDLRSHSDLVAALAFVGHGVSFPDLTYTD